MKPITSSTYSGIVVFPVETCQQVYETNFRKLFYLLYKVKIRNLSVNASWKFIFPNYNKNGNDINFIILWKHYIKSRTIMKLLRDVIESAN